MGDLAEQFWIAFLRGVNVETAGVTPMDSALSTSQWTERTCTAACRACESLRLDPRRELGRFDVIGVRWNRESTQRIWGVAYEHESAMGLWRQELRKLWRVDADLKVLVGYCRRREPIRARVEAAIQRLAEGSFELQADRWIIAFGLAELMGRCPMPWRVWTLNDQGRLEDAAFSHPEAERASGGISVRIREMDSSSPLPADLPTQRRS